MTRPAVVPRDQHTLSRSQIDPDALKVLYRLHQQEHVSYLVGGSVRDLLLGRRPKDFDVGTSAQPHEVKRLFRNCWIIGRRFRLAHVRYGEKTIEVATFRRQLTSAEREEAEARVAAEAAALAAAPRVEGERRRRRPPLAPDNTYGTPEEDASRRDFTVNALFYDIGTFSIIDYTGGLRDLQDKLIRCIGNPTERFEEDPVRMWRAVVMAARLGFRIDPPIDAAIAAQRGLLAKSAPARLIEECYKLLRTGSGEDAFRMMADRRLLDVLAPELQQGATDRLWQSLAALDSYRRLFADAPATLTNPILLGSLLVPLEHSVLTSRPAPERDGELLREPPLMLGMLPLARRDVERLRHLLAMQRRLLDPDLSVRAQRGLLHRAAFADALTWLEIHGDAPETVARWQALAAGVAPAADDEGDDHPRRRRRRRRRRGRRRPAGPTTP
jgi:poly(A) polymerase